ncbi:MULTISPECIES: hypothetical protein [Francisella]|uniref:Uncharacterized protein n=1 Tax=Francisella opportunistica TaxID=2016517 RepID=A0A345JQ05_9GAMM|nr:MULTISPECIES: hypothetical protein [Francisella]APC91090.1 hypothetical protein BBG19_0352 [Francisella sp. MA067296]AXH29401.1 hypothetical protein CGC43_01770 [Francisella opportunistica]AXH31053.1 hypothetical protein CGC44_01755 [Francisella opportunistica]AXH32698.1 hypothetical protein CGC45_01755 [Francisella opportunistica]
MRAIEFEADVKQNSITIPSLYDSLNLKHVKVIILTPDENDEKKKYDFSDVAGKLSWRGDVVSEQRKLRDEWK